MSIDLFFKKLHSCANIPSYKSEQACGFDISSIVDMKIPTGQIVLVPTGLSVSFKEGFELQIRPRSGLAIKHGISVLNSPGTIDSDYRGEIKVILINLGTSDFQIKKGDRIAQGIISKIYQANIKEVDFLDKTKRGSGGFGSSGIE